MKLTGCILWLCVPIVSCQTPKFFTGAARFSDACPSELCTRCDIGFFKSGCVGIISGHCATCFGDKPENAEWVTDGGFNNSCSYACNPAFTLTNGACVVKPDSVYVVSIKVSLPLSSADVNSQLDKIVRAFAILSNCGTCQAPALRSVQCQNCRILLTIEQTAARRLLAPTSSVSLTIEQLGGSTQAINTETALTEANINAQLTINSVPNCAVITGAALQVQPAPTVSINTAPPSTSSASSTSTQSRSTSTTPPASTSTATQGQSTTPSDGGRRGGTPPPTTQSESSSGINIGAIVGAVVGVVVFLIVCAFIACYARPKSLFSQVQENMKKSEETAPGTPTEKTQARFHARHQRTMTMMHVAVPAIQHQPRPPVNGVLVMGPVYRPQHVPQNRGQRAPSQTFPR